MKFMHQNGYGGPKTGPYETENALEVQLALASSLTQGTLETLAAEIAELRGIVARLIDALPSPQYSDPHHGGYKAHAERVAQIIGYNWEPADE